MRDRAEAGGPATSSNELRGAELRAALAVSASWLERNAEAINALNVFPVPDGDTGLNMSLTLRSAVEAAGSAAASGVGDMAAATARGALMGARGNSGVILAQILRAMARTLEGRQAADPDLLAAALQAGADAAYTAVSNPVEGTILTVAKAAAAAAQAAASRGAGVSDTLGAAHEAAQHAVRQTPDLLPILRQTGVVDAGGEGYRIFLEGLLKYVRGEPLAEGAVSVEVRADLSTLHQDPDDMYGYCTEVLFQGEDIDPRAVGERLGLLGSSVLVVGDRQLLRVHVHTLRPGAVLDIATELGEIVKVKVDNMQLQHQEFAGDAQRATGSERSAPRDGERSARLERQSLSPHPPQAEVLSPPKTGLVAVALGEGLQAIFASLGAELVPGGQTMNPSVEEIVAAINRSAGEGVIVLPNNRNVHLTAEQAAGLLPDRRVAVVRTDSIPQGISAALALNPEAPLPENAAALTQAAARCHSIELTRAVRAARLGELKIAAGALMAVVDGRPVGTGADYHELIGAALEHLPSGSYEIATVYVGDGGDAESAARIAADLTARLGIPADVAAGGQPHYDYIISVE